MALQYQEILNESSIQTTLIDLEQLPSDFISSALYENQGTNKDFNPICEHMKKVKKFVFIVPEYNGSFPGVLKTFLDGLDFPDTLKGKKCALVGVSLGVQGGVMAMSHLTDIFNYLGMHVMANKPKLTKIHTKIENGRVTDESYLKKLHEQAAALINF